MIENIQGATTNIKLEQEALKLPEEINRKIEEFWNKAKLENPNLWNGEQMCVANYKKEDKKVTIICRKSNYAHYLCDEREGLPIEYACSSLVAGCLLETSDNYYIVGELAEGTSFPHCLQVTGGSVDGSDINNGEIDIVNTIIRECQEELNINLRDKQHVEHFELKYISLPNETIHTYIFFAKGKLNLTKEQMKSYYDNYLKYLKENCLEIEFKKIHFLKKEEAAIELGNLENPKRNYLKDLLVIDSKCK